MRVLLIMFGIYAIGGLVYAASIRQPIRIQNNMVSVTTTTTTPDMTPDLYWYTFNNALTNQIVDTTGLATSKIYTVNGYGTYPFWSNNIPSTIGGGY